MSTNDMLITPEEINNIEIEAEPADANPAGLVPLVNLPPAPEAMSMSDIMNLGKILVRSGMFRSTTSADQAVAKILAGREYGLAPIQSMTHIYVIDGKVGMSAALIGAKIRQHPAYDFQVISHDDTQCSITFYYRGKEAGTSPFTIQHAKDAELIRRGGSWEKYPRNMVYARALTNGARWYCPDVFGGAIYAPEELGAVVKFDSTNQEVYEVPVNRQAVRAPQSEDQISPNSILLEPTGTVSEQTKEIRFAPVTLTVQESYERANSSGPVQHYVFGESLQFRDGHGNIVSPTGTWTAGFEAFTDNLDLHKEFGDGIRERGEFALVAKLSNQRDRWWSNIQALRTLENDNEEDNGEDNVDLPW